MELEAIRTLALEALATAFDEEGGYTANVSIESNIVTVQLDYLVEDNNILTKQVVVRQDVVDTLVAAEEFTEEACYKHVLCVGAFELCDMVAELE